MEVFTFSGLEVLDCAEHEMQFCILVTILRAVFFSCEVFQVYLHTNYLEA